jgi:hypothetical protein
MGTPPGVSTRSVEKNDLERSVGIAAHLRLL